MLLSHLRGRLGSQKGGRLNSQDRGRWGMWGILLCSMGRLLRSMGRLLHSHKRGSRSSSGSRCGWINNDRMVAFERFEGGD